MSIKTLANLRRSGVQTIDMIAALQREGIYALDIHQQWIHRKPDSREANRALELLLDQHHYETDPDKTPDNPYYNPYSESFTSPIALSAHYADMNHPDVYQQYGWPVNDLPDFADTTTKPNKRQSDITRVNDSHLLLIAALAKEVDIDLRKQTATRNLMHLLEASGFSNLSENTIRDIVHAARSALDRRCK